MRHFFTVIIALLLGFSTGVYRVEIHRWGMDAHKYVIAFFNKSMRNMPRAVAAKDKTPAVLAGRVEELLGSAQISSANGQTKNVVQGQGIYPGDKIKTSANSSVNISMQDEEALLLKSNSQLLIEEFHQSEAGSVSIKSLIQGRLRVVSGKIGKGATDVYKLRTSAVTIGIRGTEYGVAVCAVGACQSKQGDMWGGVYYAVVSGGIEVSMGTTSHSVAAGETFYQKDAYSAPLEIPNVPGLIFSHAEMQEMEVYSNGGGATGVRCSKWNNIAKVFCKLFSRGPSS